MYGSVYGSVSYLKIEAHLTESLLQITDPDRLRNESLLTLREHDGRTQTAIYGPYTGPYTGPYKGPYRTFGSMMVGCEACL